MGTIFDMFVAGALATPPPSAAAPVFATAGTAGTVAAGTALVCGKPASLAEGDLMIFVGVAGIFTYTRAGWTGPAPDVSPNPPGTVTTPLWRIADAADVAASDFDFTASGATNGVGAILRITGAHATTPFAANAQYRQESSSTDLDPPDSGSVALGNYLAVAAVSFGNDRTFTPPSGYTERVDANDLNNRTVSVATKEVNGVTSEDPGVFVCSESGTGHLWTILVAPA